MDHLLKHAPDDALTVAAQVLKHAPDGAVGAGALSAPLWMQNVDHWAQFVIFMGGVILIALRVLIALRDLKRRDETKHDQ